MGKEQTYTVKLQCNAPICLTLRQNLADITVKVKRCLCVFLSVPEPLDVEFGEVRQNGKCLDTLGKGVGGSPGLYKCHGGGGNQVSVYTSSWTQSPILASSCCVVIQSACFTEPLTFFLPLSYSPPFSLCHNPSSLPLSLLYQAWSMTSTKAIKHEEHCLGSQGSSVVLWTCISTSEDQHWEHNSMKQLVHK
jgi:hypothetical protein